MRVRAAAWAQPQTPYLSNGVKGATAPLRVQGRALAFFP